MLLVFCAMQKEFRRPFENRAGYDRELISMACDLTDYVFLVSMLNLFSDWDGSIALAINLGKKYFRPFQHETILCIIWTTNKWNTLDNTVVITFFSEQQKFLVLLTKYCTLFYKKTLILADPQYSYLFRLCLNYSYVPKM